MIPAASSTADRLISTLHQLIHPPENWQGVRVWVRSPEGQRPAFGASEVEQPSEAACEIALDFRDGTRSTVVFDGLESGSSGRRLAESMTQAAQCLVEREVEIENLFEELGFSYEGLASIHDFGSDPTVFLTPSRAFSKVLERLIAITPGLEAAIWTVGENGIEIANCSLDSVPEPRAADIGLVGKAIQEKRGIIWRRRERVEARLDPELDSARSALVSPVVAHGIVHAVVEVWNEHEDSFDSHFMRLVEILSFQLSRVIEASRLHEERLESQRLRHDLEIGAHIQEHLLLGQLPSGLEGLDVGALSIPSQHVDGDFFDFLPQSPTCLDVVMGDVMGKGVPAALVGAAVKSEFLRSGSGSPGGESRPNAARPERIVLDVHQAITNRLIELERFVTICYARFDTRRRIVTYVDCGHTSTLRLRASTGRVDALRDECERRVNLPLGMHPDSVYRQFQSTAEPGDIFVIYSDGVTEAVGPGGELYEQRRLEQTLLEHRDLSASDLTIAIRESVVAFAGADGVRDDLSCVVIKIEPLVEREEIVLEDRLSVPSSTSQLRKLRSFTSSIAEREPTMPVEILDELLLALTEAASNIMRHGYDEDQDQGILELTVRRQSDRFVMILRDWGRSFDPASVQPPDWDDLSPGGMGVYFIHELMDDVEYIRGPEGENRLTLTRFLSRRDG